METRNVEQKTKYLFCKTLSIIPFRSNKKRRPLATSNVFTTVKPYCDLLQIYDANIQYYFKTQNKN